MGFVTGEASAVRGPKVRGLSGRAFGPASSARHILARKAMEYFQDVPYTRNCLDTFVQDMGSAQVDFGEGGVRHYDTLNILLIFAASICVGIARSF
ncbi:hypothetical protein [Azospirillum sp. sgz302134]